MGNFLIHIGKSVFLTAAVLSCSASPSLLTPKQIIDGLQADKRQEHIPKVLLLGIDGVRPDALNNAFTPNLDALAAGGSFSYKAISGYHTWSGPEWSNILTGVWENKHGVTDNSFEGSNYGKYPSFLTRIEEIKPGLYTVSIDSWKINEKINTHVDKAHYHSYEDKGHSYEDKRDEVNTSHAKRILASENPDVMFVYFADVDLAGHDYGFSPEVKEYISAIEKTDLRVGEIMDALNKRDDREDWLVIAITDHGGIGKGHGGPSLEERTIFYISNKGAGEILPPPAQVDVAPTILNYLRIPVKEEWGLDGKILY